MRVRLVRVRFQIQLLTQTLRILMKDLPLMDLTLIRTLMMRDPHELSRMRKVRILLGKLGILIPSLISPTAALWLISLLKTSVSNYCLSLLMLYWVILLSLVAMRKLRKAGGGRDGLRQ